MGVAPPYIKNGENRDNSELGIMDHDSLLSLFGKFGVVDPERSGTAEHAVHHFRRLNSKPLVLSLASSGRKLFKGGQVLRQSMCFKQSVICSGR